MQNRKGNTLLTKIIEGAIAVILIGALGLTVVTSLGSLDLSNVSGLNLTFVVLIVAVGFFVGAGLMIYKHLMGGKN